jgi:Ribulose-phosphate 3 epimerase family/Transposase domain (DUF772)
MMGRQDEPEQLFYAFRLESRVPRNHLLRGIDAVLDFGAIRKSLQPYYSSTGRPSIDPELMIRMLLIGYSFGIRSEPIISSLRRVTHLPLEAHLMISNPDFFVDEFAKAGTDSFLVHWEGNNDLSRTVQSIRAEHVTRCAGNFIVVEAKSAETAKLNELEAA